MKYLKNIFLICTLLFLSACDLTDDVVDTLNSVLIQEELDQMLKTDKKKKEKEESRIMESIKNSVEDDVMETMKQHFKEKNIQYDEIIFQNDFQVSKSNDTLSINHYVVSNVQFFMVKSTLGIKDIYKYKGKVFYNDDGKYNGIDMKYVGKERDSTGFWRGLETAGKLYENFKDKNNDSE